MEIKLKKLIYSKTRINSLLYIRFIQEFLKDLKEMQVLGKEGLVKVTSHQLQIRKGVL